MSKGDKPRKIQCTREEYEKRFEKAFGKKKESKLGVK